MTTQITQLLLISTMSIGFFTVDAQNQDKSNTKTGLMSKESELWYEQRNLSNSNSKKDSVSGTFDIISIHSTDIVNGTQVSRNLMVEDKDINYAKAVTGQDVPNYVVTYEVTPKNYQKCSYPMNTIIFEVPVSEDYYNSVYLKQEVTSWFRTFGGVDLRGSFKSQKPTDRWVLTIIDKRIVSKQENYPRMDFGSVDNKSTK